MAEVVTLASFDFDTDRLNKSIDEATESLFRLQKEQKAYREESKKLEDQLKKLRETEQLLINANQKQSDSYDVLQKEIDNTIKKQEENFKSQKNLQTQQQKVNREYQELSKVKQILLDKNAVEITSTDALNDALKREVNTRAEAKKNNIEINRIKDQLNVNDAEQLKLLDQLNEKVNQNNQLLKDSGSAWEKQISNVGNYKNDIKEAYNELNLFNGGLTGFATRATQAGGAGALLSNSLKTATSATVGLTKSMLAFMATPLGLVLTAIAGAFALITNAMNNNQESANKLGGVFTTLGKIFSGFLAFLEPIGTFLIDGIVAGFEAVMNTATKVIDVLSSLAGALGLDTISQGLKDFSNGLKTASNEAQRLVDINNELLRTQASYNREVGKLKEAFKEENKIAEDTSKTLKEREQAVRNSIVASERLQEIDVKRLELEKERAMLEEENAIQRDIIASEYEQKINEINASALEAQTTQNNKLNIIRQQVADQEIKRQQELLALFIEQQGFKARTLEEELKLSQDVAKKQEAILKKQLENNKISQIEYNKEILKIKNDLLFQQSKIASEQGKRELEEFIKTQQSILREGELYNKETLDQDIESLENIKKKKLAFQQEQFELELINEREFEQSKLDIQEKFLQKSGEIRNRYLDQQKQQDNLRKTLEFEQDMLDLEDRFATQFEIEQAQADFKYQEELLKLQEQRDNNLITNENYLLALNNLERNYAKTSSEIEKMKQEYNLQVASSTLGNIAKLLGEQSSAGKAFSIAQTTIDTYLGAQKAFTSQIVAGDPTSLLRAYIASTGAVVAGLANVKNILKVKEPNFKTPGAVKLENVQGFATGGVVGDGLEISRNNGDNRLITARTGEVILNESQRAIIGDNALAMAGVPNISPSSISSVQSSITNGFDIEAMVNAVRDGARQGSYIGSSKGSQDGIVGLSENRIIQNQSSF